MRGSRIECQLTFERYCNACNVILKLKATSTLTTPASLEGGGGGGGGMAGGSGSSNSISTSMLTSMSSGLPPSSCSEIKTSDHENYLALVRR